jgi:pyruvate formate lyase activating enzyme
VRTLGTIREISLLPYHKLGRDKYAGLEKKAGGDDFTTPSSESMQTIKKCLEEYGFRVSLGE